MKALVLCIDRDNDIGSKTDRVGPIIGEEENLQVAEELALSDPEDSDLNALYASIKLARELEDQAVLATITGSSEVGIRSDREISRQLEEVLNKIDAERAIVVTDGAEDENIIPLIESRVRIDSIKRVIVRQNQNLETTYYLAKRFMEDPKVMRTIFIPLGLAFLAYSILNFVGYPEFAISGIFAVVGLYLIIKAAGADETVYNLITEVKNSFTTGSISFITYIASFILLVVGGIQGYFTWLDTVGESNLVLTAHILQSSIWWFVIAAILFIVGKAIDEFISKSGSFWRYSLLPFFGVSTGLVIWGGSSYIIELSEGAPIAGARNLVFSIMGGIVIALGGMFLLRYLKKIIYSHLDPSIPK